jgi:hypothetical protein
MSSAWKGVTSSVMATGLTEPAAAGKPPVAGLLAWAESTRRRAAEAPGRGGLRFAFYGRVSTED